MMVWAHLWLDADNEIHFLPDSIRLADPFSPLTFPSVLAFSSPLFTLSVMDTYYLLSMHSPIKRDTLRKMYMLEDILV